VGWICSQSMSAAACLAATVIVLTDDEAGDAGLIRELGDAEYDGVVIVTGASSGIGAATARLNRCSTSSSLGPLKETPRE
jgi:hypothetical protein